MPLLPRQVLVFFSSCNSVKYHSLSIYIYIYIYIIYICFSSLARYFVCEQTLFIKL